MFSVFEVKKEISICIASRYCYAQAARALRPRPGLQLQDVLQNALICFNDMPPTGVVLPVVTGAGSCAALDPANPLLTSTTRISEWRR
jgi:hypothetical protein